MSAFNFNSFAQVKPANSVSYLKPYTINHNITIKETKIEEGISSEGKSWKSLVITFGNDEGIYKDSTFFLDINDPKVIERNTSDMSNGGKRQLPSRWEQTYYKLAAIGYYFAPELIDKFNSVVGKCKTFDDFIKAFKAMIDKVANKTTTSMKLIGRNNNGRIYATLPSCVGIAQATDEKKAAANKVQVGEWYTWMVSPFGSGLSFSDYEESKKSELASAKPTAMKDNNSDIPSDINNEIKDSEDIDFESLLDV